MTEIVTASVTGGLFLCIASTLIHRTGKLSFRYFAGWLVVGIGLLGFGGLLAILRSRKNVSDLATPAAVVLALCVLGLLLQLSISVSGLQRQVRALAERAAIDAARKPADADAAGMGSGVGPGIGPGVGDASSPDSATHPNA